MGRKTPRLSMLESGTDADMTLLSCWMLLSEREEAKGYDGREEEEGG